MAVDFAHAIFGSFVSPSGIGAVAVAADMKGQSTISTSGDAGQCTPLTEHTLFNIGSIAKPLAGVVLADMTLRSEVDLGAPVATYLPETSPSVSGSVTIDQLATHRAGLPLRPPSSEGNDPISQYDGVTRTSVINDFSECVPAAAGQYLYSNFGYAVLGQVLERVAGLEWSILLRERLLRPLGMEDTWWFYDENLDTARVATPMGKRGQALAERDVSGLIGAGGLYSTVGDMGRLVRACLRPRETAVGEALTLAMTPRGAIASTDGNQRFIGLGWLLLDLGQVPMQLVWKNGHGPGNHSFFGVVPSEGVGLVALSNHHHSDRFDRAAVNALAQGVRGS